MSVEDVLFSGSFYLSIVIALAASIWSIRLHRVFNSKITMVFLIINLLIGGMSIFMSVNVILGAWPVAIPQIISLIQVTTLFVLNLFLKGKNENAR